MIEGLIHFRNVGGRKKGLSETSVQESVSGKKYLPYSGSANFENFEDDDKVEHHS